MKLTIDRRLLAETLKWVTAALDKRPTTPAMSGVRITATDTAVTFTAWDYTAAHTATLEVTGADPRNLAAVDVRTETTGPEVGIDEWLEAADV